MARVVNEQTIVPLLINICYRMRPAFDRVGLTGVKCLYHVPVSVFHVPVSSVGHVPVPSVCHVPVSVPVSVM